MKITDSFFECLTCGHKFLTDETLTYCPYCEKKTAGFKTIPINKVAICNHCADILWTDGHKENHFCWQSEEDIYWINDTI